MHGNANSDPFEYVSVGHESGCWLWTGARDPLGYGRLTFRRRNYLAHRWVYTELVGPIPERHALHHRCENPSCVRPSHLEPLLYKAHSRIGGMARLTPEQVAEIRAADCHLKRGQTSRSGVVTQGQLAKRYGVARTTISGILNDKRWA